MEPERTTDTSPLGSEWLPNAWPPDYLLASDLPPAQPSFPDDTSFIPFSQAQRSHQISPLGTTFYTPRKTFLWYTGELHADPARRGLTIDYSVRPLTEAGFCQGEVHVSESGTEFSPVSGWNDPEGMPEHTYLPNRVCDWVISAPYGHRIHLKIANLLFQPGDRVTVDDECAPRRTGARTPSRWTSPPPRAPLLKSSSTYSFSSPSRRSVLWVGTSVGTWSKLVRTVHLGSSLTMTHSP